MSSNAKRNCTEIGSNVELPKNVSWAFSCKISKTKAQLPGGTTEAAKNLLLSSTLHVDPLLNGPGNLMTEDTKRMRNMMSAVFCCDL